MSVDTDLRADRGDAPTGARDGSVGVLVALAGIVLVGVLAAWLWAGSREPAAPPPPPPIAAAPAPAPVREEAAPPPQPAAPSVLHPIEADDKPFDPAEIPAALGGVLGGKAAASFLQVDNFPHRFVATVDSLARDHSPTAMWPVLPTPGRFLVDERTDGPVIAADNAARYTPFVLLAGTLDVPAAVRLYRRMYPLLQQASRELGLGDRYLNDRVVEVIDVLLATPEAPESPRLELVDVKGPIPSTRPWVRYHFADPSLESLTAGQKILVRMGPVNEHRLKSKLSELRGELVAAGSARAPGTSDAGPGRPPAPPQPGGSQPR